MLARIAAWRARPGVHRLVATLRLMIGFAFVPAGLKKVLGQPFTDPDRTGPFHDFLHAFYATGWFYNFVGALQLLIAGLLMTQRYAGLGALAAVPVLTAITAFCWSTAVVPTAIVATLMLLGSIALVAWELPRLWPPASAPTSATLDVRLWGGCGGVIIGLYLALCAGRGEVYRPRRVQPDDPAFYVMPLIALLPLLTWLVERRRLARNG